LEGKKVVALGHKAQRRPHSSWQASDDSRFIVLTSIIKKWRAKNFDATCDFLFAKQEIAFCRIAPKLLTSCPCDDGLSKNVISQSDRSTRAHARLRMTVSLHLCFEFFRPAHPCPLTPPVWPAASSFF
jgi:hypothetical protein